MSGWWHPAGPESVAIYWSRRFVVIATAVLVLVLGIVLVTTGAQGSEPAGTAVPAATTGAPVPPAASPTPGAGSPTPTSGGSSSSEASEKASQNGSEKAGEKASEEASSTAGGTAASKSGTEASASPSATASGTPSSTPTKPALPTCDPSRLRATLRGNPSPTVDQRVVFTLSLTNDGDRACTFTRTADTVELRVYSGTDRIWSTADCATLVRPVAHLVKPGGVVSWKIAWNGARSAKGCQTRPEAPRPGTYFATFQFAGAQPVQQRMVLTAS